VRKADAEDMVTIEVERQAFSGGRVRTVVIPFAQGVGPNERIAFWREVTTDQRLGHLFYTGRAIFILSRITAQSEFGDIIRLEGTRCGQRAGGEENRAD